MLISDNNIGDEGIAVLIDCEKPASLKIKMEEESSSSKWNPLLHLDTTRGWDVPAHFPSLKFFLKALCFSYGITVSLPRWFVVLACVVAFFLPGLVHDGEEFLTDGALNSTSTSIVDALGDVCDDEMLELRNSFFDPVTGLLAVSSTVCLHRTRPAHHLPLLVSLLAVWTTSGYHGGCLIHSLYAVGSPPSHSAPSSRNSEGRQVGPYYFSDNSIMIKPTQLITSCLGQALLCYVC